MFENRFKKGKKKKNKENNENKGNALKSKIMENLNIDDMILEDNELKIQDMSGIKTKVL